MKVVTQTTANGQTTSATHTLDFTYDASGSPVAVTYDGTVYYYALNLQGDVVAILNGSGSTVVSYTYDAWGYEKACTGTLSGTLGYYNPLRYRGYVYDTETKLYYLQSRYYNPGLGRFLNADAFTSTGQGILGNNMFAYCRNNPVSRIDISGSADTPIEEEFDDDVEVTPPVPDAAGGGGIGGNSVAGGTGSTSTGGNLRYDDTKRRDNEQRALDGNSGNPGKSSGYRGKLQKLTGSSGEGKQAHHVFPQKFRDKFKAIDINVDLPKYGAWWDTTDHLKNAYIYNKSWEMYLGLENPSQRTAMIFAELLSIIFGFETNFDE